MKFKSYIFRKPAITVSMILCGLVLVPVMLFLMFDLIYPLPKHKLTRPHCSIVMTSDDEVLNINIACDEFWRIPTEIDDIPLFMRDTLLEYEDRWFYYHPGVNPLSLARAAISNIRQRRVVSGGSTITMQVARMIEPKQRTMKSKVFEIFRALQIESRYSKNEILEFYFNLAPYGGNIEGIGAASYFYFGKSPSILSKSEMLALVGLPNSPTRLRPDTNPDASRQHRDKIADLMLAKNMITPHEHSSITDDPMPGRLFHRPLNAPHLSRLARNRNPLQSNVNTTVDYRIQLMCEQKLTEHLEPLLRYGISNGAIVVIDNKTRSVLAMVGSRDFNDKQNAGQVNGALAPRSPGSALKPFIYALAIDQGLISPKMMLADVPVNYSGYSPKNFDEKYRGGVSAEVALMESLNVPAVNLHYQVGDRFYNLLINSGVRSLNKPWEHYGLPLVLGGGEISLLELTNLYAALASGGTYLPPRLMADDNEYHVPKQIISDGAAYIISEILSDVHRPELPYVWEFAINQPKIAWKTGTSYGYRDAWSIGYNPDFTVGVWIGNFCGKDAEMLIGREVAAPLLFDIFNQLSDSSRWFDRPDSVGEREVCALSGMIATDNCRHRNREMFVYGKSPVRPCTMHQTYLVDSESGMRIPRALAGQRDVTAETFEIWPASIASWRQREGYPIDDIPELYTGTGRFFPGMKPQINSPSDNAVFRLRDGIPLEHQKILLQASVPNTVNKLYWFVNGDLHTVASPDTPVFYHPETGRHKIACMDNQGNSASVTIRIR